ncbi:AAA family ATPase [Bacillus sp. FJAT-27251]|uniref:AAA family ATPase n=1 Tax=Bacillus sp. FJAT-27251 TaxID=1684142 RepID=UPI0006A7A014|nr:AAA family ATPase [Bacillus sp. FJAT-27251]
MSISWYYFSDTNTPPGEIEAYLAKKEFSLVKTNDIGAIHRHLMEDHQAVLFLRANSIYNVYDLCQEISVLYPHVYIVLIVPDNMENLKKAMHMGASDILRTSYSYEELKESFQQAKKYMEHRAEKSSGQPAFIKGKSRVIAVSGPKGGVGKTSLAVNLAIASAKKGKRVAVIDAHIQFGDIAMYFNEKPKRTIYEWVKEAYGRSTYSIDQYMMKHDSGVSFLAAPPRPEFFEGITEEHIKAAIEEAKKQFDIVFIDLPGYLSEIHISCLDSADDILLLFTNDISVLRTTKLYLETLETINLKDKVKLILNMHSKKQGLELKKVEEIFDLKIHATLPKQEKIAASAISTGWPFVLADARSQLSKGVLQLSEKLYEQEVPKLVTEKRKKIKRRILLKA